MPKSDPADLTQLLSARRQQKEVVTPTQEIKTSVTVTPQIEVEPKKVGRPPGRRSDPHCRSLTLLVNEDVIADAQYKLRKLNRGKSPKQSLSDLVEELLEGWLEKA